MPTACFAHIILLHADIVVRRLNIWGMQCFCVYSTALVTHCARYLLVPYGRGWRFECDYALQYNTVVKSVTGQRYKVLASMSGCVVSTLLKPCGCYMCAIASVLVDMQSNAGLQKT